MSVGEAKNFTLTVENGGTYTDSETWIGRRYGGIQLPATWDGASIGFEVAFDDGVWKVPVDADGSDLPTIACAAGDCVVLPWQIFCFPRWRLTCSAQGAAREIQAWVIF